MRLLGLGVKSAHIVEEFEHQIDADALGRGFRAQGRQELLGV